MIDIKLPLDFGSADELINASAGTNLPETKIIKKVVVTMAKKSDDDGRFVIAIIGKIEIVATILKTSSFPSLSDNLPIDCEVKKVKIPPKK